MKNKKLLFEIRRMQELAGIISENSNFLEEAITKQWDITTKIEDIKSQIKKLGGNNGPNTSQHTVVEKEIKDLIEDFVHSTEVNAWPIFAEKKDDPKALEDFKREFIINEIDNSISNFFFNSGSGSFVRMYSDPYKTWVVVEMKKVADALNIKRLKSSIDRFLAARQSKNEPSAIDQMRQKAGIEPKNVTSESEVTGEGSGFSQALVKMVNEDVMTGLQLGMGRDEQSEIDGQTKDLTFKKELKKSSEPNMVNQYTWKGEDGKIIATLEKTKNDNSNIAFFYKVQVGNEPPQQIPAKPDNWKMQLEKAISKMKSLLNPVS